MIRSQPDKSDNMIEMFACQKQAVEVTVSQVIVEQPIENYYISHEYVRSFYCFGTGKQI